MRNSILLAFLVLPMGLFAQQNIEAKIDSIMTRLSLNDKLGQLNQRGTSSSAAGNFSALKQAVRAGQVGSFLNVMDTALHNDLQRIAMYESTNGIPLIFGRDVIHGFKTIFPIPLGQAASWNPSIAEEGAKVAAREASSAGVDWTFAPMMDIARDPRWGRIAESCGEDHVLTAAMVTAMIKGFQGDDLADPYTIAACAKHYAAYGAAEGGRDYNSVYLPDNLLRDVYLHPFHAAVDANVATFMSSFNDVNGVPSSGNRYLLTDVLRAEWGFDGFVVSDWNSVTEMINHGFAADAKHAAELGINAGLDMEMMSTAYAQYAQELLEQGKIKIESIDNAVRNILRIKLRLGLFDDPYVHPETDIQLCENHKMAALKAAEESIVLLENNNQLLPINQPTKLAIIGPLADAGHEQLGTWAFDGEGKDCITPKTAFQDLIEEGYQISFAPGLAYSRDSTDHGFEAALVAAEESDIVLFFGGEEAILSGEAHSRANIRLPGRQEELITKLSAKGKPIVLVILAGRPIVISPIMDHLSAVLMSWHPGTMGGQALANIITGKVVPSGKLPVSYPLVVGQIPLYYNHTNTGRPAVDGEFIPIDQIPVGAWQSSLGNTSHYLDAGFLPQYPFGYGLTYSTVRYENLTLSSKKISHKSPIIVSTTVVNTGLFPVHEVVQLYVQDRVGSRTRPIRELKQFQKIELAPGMKTEVEFKVTLDELKFTTVNNIYEVEKGTFRLWVAPHSSSGLEADFTY